MKSELISIIMNCHNGEKFLKKALNSILQQTYENWELIFWDNKSSDKSKNIFKKFKDSRFKYFYAKKFSDLHRARNFAIKKAKGKFITFLDTDDFWLPDKLTLQIKKFTDRSTNFVYGNCWLIKKNYLFNKKIYYPGYLPEGYILNHLLKSYTIPLPTIMIRTSALKKLKFIFNDKLKIIGDFDLSIRLSEKNKFKCLQEPIAFYRIHDNNFSSRNRLLEIKELTDWYYAAKKGKFGKNISINPNLKFVKKKIKNLNFIYNSKMNFTRSFLFLIKNFNNENLIIFLKVFMPSFIKKRVFIYC